MKTNKILKLFPLIGLVFLSLTCEKEENAIVPKATTQEVFFEVTYLNFAWGERASVFYVKSDGTVKFQNGKPKYFNSEMKNQLTETELKENLELASISKKQIPAAELSKYSSLISGLTETNFSKKISGGADRGSFMYTAYQFNETEKVYKAIKLAEDGDFVSVNLDPNAKLITEWLKSMQTEVYTN